MKEWVNEFMNIFIDEHTRPRNTDKVDIIIGNANFPMFLVSDYEYMFLQHLTNTHILDT